MHSTCCHVYIIIIYINGNKTSRSCCIANGIVVVLLLSYLRRTRMISEPLEHCMEGCRVSCIVVAFWEMPEHFLIVR